VRGRRVVATPEEGEECEMFQLGRDVDHVSLRVPEDIPEEPEILLPNGRVVRREDMFEGLLDEYAVFVEDAVAPLVMDGMIL
jgi:hypothetical protein